MLGCFRTLGTPAHARALTLLYGVPGVRFTAEPERVAENEEASPMPKRTKKPNSQQETLEQAIIRGVGWGLGISAVVALYALSWLPVILE